MAEVTHIIKKIKNGKLVMKLGGKVGKKKKDED